MSDELKVKNNVENEDMVEEVVTKKTEVLSESIPKVKEEKKVSVAKKTSKKPNFFLALVAIISDGIIIGAITLAIVFLMDIIMRNTVGYYIVEMVQMSFIIYVSVTVIYVSVVEAALGFTVGKTIVGLKVVTE